MEIQKRVILLVQILSLQGVQNEITRGKWKRRKEECKMLQENITGQQQASKLYGCIAMCEVQVKCETISWQINGNVCIFSDKNVVDDNRPRFTKWELSDGWITYSKVIYPVARVMNPEQDTDATDIMEYDVAVQACADQGSSIATPSDLLDARDAGMDTCACGWISTGVNGGITPLSGTCDSFNSTNEIEYCSNQRAIAWCKLN